MKFFLKSYSLFQSKHDEQKDFKIFRDELHHNELVMNPPILSLNATPFMVATFLATIVDLINGITRLRSSFVA